MKKVVYCINGDDSWNIDIKWRHENNIPTPMWLEDGWRKYVLEFHVNEEQATLLKLRHPEAEITESDWYDET